MQQCVWNTEFWCSRMPTTIWEKESNTLKTSLMPQGVYSLDSLLQLLVTNHFVEWTWVPCAVSFLVHVSTWSFLPVRFLLRNNPEFPGLYCIIGVGVCLATRHCFAQRTEALQALPIFLWQSQKGDSDLTESQVGFSVLGVLLSSLTIPALWEKAYLRAFVSETVFLIGVLSNTLRKGVPFLFSVLP